MKMPPPIATKFTKLVLTILAITILGIILSFISQDHTLLMLSAGVAVAGGVKMKKRSGCVKNEKDLSSEDLSILVQHRMLLGLWSQPVLRKRSWMRNISGSARAMTRPLKNGQWIATIGDGSCVRFAAELSRMCRCPITVAREVQTGESVPIVHEMVVANPHSWLDIIRMMVYY